MNRAGLASSPWFLGAVLCVAGVLTYANSLTTPFVFDDLSAIAANPSIRSVAASLTPPAGGSLTVEGRPLLNVSFALNYAVGGTDVRGYHVVNLAIHIVATFTLFGVVRRALAGPVLAARFAPVARSLAFATALLWELHPVQTESVTYVVQRAESLASLFYLLTLYFFSRGIATAAPRAWFSASVVACLLGMATKEVMATAPVLVLLYDRAFFAGTFRAAWQSRRTFYAMLAATWLPLAWLVAASGGNRIGIMGVGLDVSWPAHLLSQAESFARYLGLAVWPNPLVFEYGWFRPKALAHALPWLLLIAPLLIVTARGVRSGSAPGFIGASFFLMLSPASLVPSTTQLLVEHRVYLPLAGVIALGVIVVHRWLDRPGRGASRTLALASATAVAFAALTLRRNHDYRSDVALWQDTVAKRPDNALAHLLLGEAWEGKGNAAAALDHYENSRRLRPEFVLPHGNAGRLLLQAGREDEAERALGRALELKPDFAAAHEAMGVLLTRRGRLVQAITHLRAVLTYDPNHAAGHFNLAVALAKAGNLDEAIARYQAALALQPSDVAARYNLANALHAQGQNEAAIHEYRSVIRLRPQHVEAHHNLAGALAAAGRLAEAAGHFQAALQHNPLYPQAHYNYAVLLQQLGQMREATHHYEAALRLNPDFAAARNALQLLQPRR